MVKDGGSDSVERLLIFELNSQTAVLLQKLSPPNSWTRIAKATTLTTEQYDRTQSVRVTEAKQTYKMSTNIIL